MRSRVWRLCLDRACPSTVRKWGLNWGVRTWGIRTWGVRTWGLRSWSLRADSGAEHIDAIAEPQSLQSQYGAATELQVVIAIDTQHHTVSTKHIVFRHRTKHRSDRRDEIAYK
jgi:hypothetical protein